MAKIFMFKKNIYSVSDRNALGEFVVVKLSPDKKNVLGAKLITARTEFEVEKHVRMFPFEVFKNLPNNPIE